MLSQALDAGNAVAVSVHVTPSVEVLTSCEPDLTATNLPLPYVIAVHPVEFNAPEISQTSPSCEIATVVLSLAIATNLPFPNTTSFQAADAGNVDGVHVTPSAEYAAAVEPLFNVTNLETLRSDDPSSNS